MRVGLLQVVRGEEDRAAAPGVGPHRLPEGVPGLHVEGRRRLVQDQQVGAAGQREGEAHPLDLAAGEPVHAPPGQRGDPRQLQGLPDGHRRRVPSGHEGDQLAHGDPGHRPCLLEHGPHPAGAHRGFRRAAEQLHRARVGRAQAEQQGDRRRLAGAVAAEQCDGLPAPDAQVHAVDGADVAVRLGRSREGDGGVGALGRCHARDATEPAGTGGRCGCPEFGRTNVTGGGRPVR